jgi:hypothetical protein
MPAAPIRCEATAPRSVNSRRLSTLVSGITLNNLQDTGGVASQRREPRPRDLDI